MQLIASRKRFILAILLSASFTGVFFLPHVLRIGSSPVQNFEESDLESWSSSNPTATKCEVSRPPAATVVVDPLLDPLHSFVSLNGPPTAAYKDNLRNHTKYITSWGSSAGWANDVISLMNLIYLGLITDRVSILPPHTSTHLPWESPSLPFGEAFDVPRLRRALGTPVLEWREVKQTDSEVLDDIGCWNVWESVQYSANTPRHSIVHDKLRLDISYTKTPQWIKMIPNYEHDQHCTFWSLAALAFPDARAANLVPPLPSPQHQLSLPPDEQLLCFDYLYYVAAQEPFEIGLDYSPAWRYVGQHMHWTPVLDRLTNEYIRHSLRLDAEDPIPPFYFRPRPAGRLSGLVKAEIWEQKQLAVNHVIITSDEKDPAWWQDVSGLGWWTPDHAELKTEERFGVWYPVLIDAAIHSRGSGVCGDR
ncbi:hypothetical protein MSAN_02241400 [Mycena sanguinolenta]|uniref:Uncharacterized protein n=1 Tax=Mycena sanguinolenta TaxID=230812 RepID=A0A8H6XBH2_9AGAR|nr:hypothetical protein MSAN_02241400 [Mycena sanguinolenta]